MSRKAIAIAVVLLVSVVVVSAQRRRFRGPRIDFDSVADMRLETQANFAFARVQFQSFRQRRSPGWSHDYPRAERNLLTILGEFTTVYTTSRDHTVVRLDSPDIMRFPVLYFSEPGTWAISQAEVANFRDYLARGGFAIFDDFDGPWDWDNFEAAMTLVLPGQRFERLELEEPVFQSFFHIKTLDMIPPYGAYDVPSFWGIRDDAGRLQVVANFNNDIGDYWEWSDQGFYPIELSNEGYKFGVNYIIYGLTH